MKYSYNWLRELYPKLGASAKAADLLTRHSFTVESVEKSGGDWVFDIDNKSLGRRAADASGHVGMARELAVIRGDSLDPPGVKIVEEARAAKNLLGVRVEGGGLVPRYAVRIIDNIQVGSSPKWMQERLKTCGLRPINVVVDVTNYVMLECGQPLHAFDYDRLRGGAKKEIIVRFAKNNEQLKTLDNQLLTLTKDDLVIADSAGAIGLAGIKGGVGSEIVAGTKRVILEAANFDPVFVRRTSNRVGLYTDASWRFQHGMDPEGIPHALNRAAELLLKLAKGKILKGVIDAYGKRNPSRSIPFSTQRAGRMLGVSIPEAKALSILKRLGCVTKRQGNNRYAVLPPSFRPDLAIEEDLVEEVGRIWGYERIKSEMPLFRAGIPSPDARRVFENQIIDRMVGLGFTESHLSAFTGEYELEVFGLSPKEHYRLQNPTSPETEYLVMVPATKFLVSVAENLRRSKRVGIFGMARAFIKTPKGPKESRRLVIVLAEERGKDGREEFYVLKGVIDTLLESFGFADYWYDDAALKRHGAWANPHRAAEVKVGDALIGVIAEANARVTDALKARSRIVAAEFFIDRLLAETEEEREFEPPSKYPAVVRDIAVIVPDNVRADDAEGVIQNSGGPLLADSDLFDYFQDEAMGERGEKSLAFHLVFQSPERTLTDEEVGRIYKKIVAAVKEKGWEVRE